MTISHDSVQVRVRCYLERSAHPRRWRVVVSLDTQEEAFAAGPWKLGRPGVRAGYNESQRLMRALQEATTAQAYGALDAAAT